VRRAGAENFIEIEKTLLATPVSPAYSFVQGQPSRGGNRQVRREPRKRRRNHEAQRKKHHQRHHRRNPRRHGQRRSRPRRRRHHDRLGHHQGRGGEPRAQSGRNRLRRGQGLQRHDRRRLIRRIIRRLPFPNGRRRFFWWEEATPDWRRDWRRSLRPGRSGSGERPPRARGLRDSCRSSRGRSRRNRPARR